jgi:hypothetical protein
MEELTNIIFVNHVDKEMAEMFGTVSVQSNIYDKCYTGNEEFFLRLRDKYLVPHFPIHHDVRKSEPESHYLTALKTSFERLIPLVSDVFAGCTYFFDPGEIMKPCFFRLYKIEEKSYLYLVRVDLTCRPQYGDITEWGNNDITPEYLTACLFLEAHFIPLDEVQLINGKVAAFKIKQTISETWIGEHGRGYLLRGIWIDDELTKFFTKLFLPEGLHSYPYYPFLCKYKTMCLNLINLSPKEREKELPYLHRALSFIVPSMRKIEESMKSKKFSETLDIFQALKKKVPAYWSDVFGSLRIRAYLNRNNMKEFEIEQ